MGTHMLPRDFFQRGRVIEKAMPFSSSLSSIPLACIGRGPIYLDHNGYGQKMRRRGVCWVFATWNNVCRWTMYRKMPSSKGPALPPGNETYGPQNHNAIPENTISP